MSVQAKRYPLRFEKVTRIAYDEWPQDWLQECDIGDLLLGPGSKATFGILCIDSSGAFVNLTPAQIYEGQHIPWNDPDNSIFAIRLRGDLVEIVRD